MAHADELEPIDETAIEMALPSVRFHDKSNDERWRDFVASSNNGTLFHELEFLAYHPSNRFEFRHLEVWHEEMLLSVIPGGLSSDGKYWSPLGASIGGPVLGPNVRTDEVIGTVAALQEFAVRQGWRGIEVVLPPPVIHRTMSQSLEFALHYRGFALSERSLPLMVPLQSHVGPNRFEKLFSKGQRSAVRTNRNRGVQVREGGIEALPLFLRLLEETYSRHGTAPTHSGEEIRELLMRLPKRIQIWLAHLDGDALAGVLLFRLNQQVCTTFYICDDVASRGMHGTSVLLATLIDVLADQQIRYLDLGPSAATGRMNTGVVSFKENIGAEGFCRDRYSWIP